jgi:hypothetical protein
MPHPRYTSEQIARQGEEIYDRRLRATLEPENRGEFLVIDIETGDYELDADEVEAVRRAMARHPEGARYIKRVGYATAHRIGRSFVKAQP